MRIQKAGTITDQILLLGSRHGSMYLIMGDKYALLGGGVAWEVPRLEAQLDRFQIDRNRIQYLVISHAHHDHCGAVPYLIARYPHIQKIASPYCTHILNKSQPVHLMREVNRKILESLNRPHFHDGISLDFRPLPIERQVADGDRFDLGGHSVRVLDVSGHTQGHIAYYFEDDAILFSGDALFALGCGRLFEGSADQMCTSLQKVMALPDDTVVYCAHEYTQANAKFALSVEPQNEETTQRDSGACADASSPVEFVVPGIACVDEQGTTEGPEIDHAKRKREDHAIE